MSHTSQHPGAPDAVLAADVGRTTCRVTCYRDGAAGPVRSSASGSSLVDRDGVASLVAVVLEAAEWVLEDGGGPDIVAIGVTGAAQDRDAVQRFAAGIQARFPAARVVVTTDVVTAHAGALAARPGVVMVAGTGAVALAASEEAVPRIVDGAGWLLGDDGGGVSIGRAGLRAALRWQDGRDGGSADLAAAAQGRFGPLANLIEQVQGDRSPARVLASFAPDVVELAGGDEPVARRILQRAVSDLAETTVVACQAMPPADELAISYSGGLFTRTDLVTAPWRDAVTRAVPRARVHDPAGDALYGAYSVVAADSWLYGELMYDFPPGREGPGRAAVG